MLQNNYIVGARKHQEELIINLPVEQASTGRKIDFCAMAYFFSVRVRCVCVASVRGRASAEIGPSASLLQPGVDGLPQPVRVRGDGRGGQAHHERGHEGLPEDAALSEDH